VEKIAGALAERGASLAEVAAVAAEVNERSRSFGVALTSCTVPAAGKPTFQLSEDEMEMGVGIHGEPGRRRVPFATADVIANELVNSILNDLGLKRGTPVLLFVNGFGGTPALELYLMANAARRVLGDAGLTVARSLTGSYVTSLEMAGCSVTITAVDDSLVALWDAPVHTAALRWAI
jgi:phosphoenolpyruvate---glycerone phosphotransferase subunit DhaK